MSLHFSHESLRRSYDWSLRYIGTFRPPLPQYSHFRLCRLEEKTFPVACIVLEPLIRKALGRYVTSNFQFIYWGDPSDDSVWRYFRHFVWDNPWKKKGLHIKVHYERNWLFHGTRLQFVSFSSFNLRSFRLFFEEMFF